MHNAFFGNFDLASLSIWLFWAFFALLIYYIQRENMREGYPLEDDDGATSANQGPFPVPEDKTFILPHGRGELSLPSGQKPERAAIALRKTAAGNGSPFEPSKAEAFFVSAGSDPRGMPVVSGDKKVVGTVTDLWIDEPEALVRYIEYDLGDGAGTRLVPITMARIWFGKVMVQSIYADQFAGVPRNSSDSQITLLEEEKICAYYGGGYLYASEHRQEPQL